MSSTEVPPFSVSWIFTYLCEFYLRCEFSWGFPPPLNELMVFYFTLPLLDPFIFLRIMTQDLFFFKYFYHKFLSMRNTWKCCFFPVRFSIACALCEQRGRRENTCVCCFLAVLQLHKARCIFQFCLVISDVNLSTDLGSAKCILSLWW